MSSERGASELRWQADQLWPAVRKVWIFAVLSGLLSLSPTVYMMEVYGRVITSRSEATLAWLTLAVVAVYAGMELLNWVVGEIMHHAGRGFEERLAPKVLERVFASALNSSSEASQQPLLDLRTLREFVYSPGFLALLEAPVALVFLAIMFAISPILGYFSIVGALIQLGLIFVMERKVRPPLAEAGMASLAAQSFANNAQRNAEVVEAMGMLAGIHSRWIGLQRRYLFLQAKASDDAGLFSTSAKSVMLIQGSAGLGLSFWLMIQGEIAHGGIAILGGVIGGKVLQPLVQVVSHWREVAEARDAYGRLDGLLGAHSDPVAPMPLPDPVGRLAVESVTAGAPGSSVPILRNVSFQLEPGECLAIIGPSACGKTTLARVVLGLWPTMSGQIRLDGAEIRSWSKLDLGKHLGYLPQDVELFEGTVADNICRFADRDEDALSEALAIAGLEELVASLPSGTETPIGVDGAFLSGGQRQRIGIARAIYKAPRLIVLDEPNSSLDDAGEVALTDMILRLKSLGSTVIVVTHRKAILPAVDKLLVMRDGSVQLCGPRDQVLAALQPQAPRAVGGRV